MDNKVSTIDEVIEVNNFRKDLTDLINRYSLEQLCNTPDFMLSDYLVSCFNNYCDIKNSTDNWFKAAPTKEER